MRRTFAFVLALALALGLLAGCGSAGQDSGSQKLPRRKAVESAELQFAAPAEGDTIAVFDTSLGEIRALLYPELAPMAVQNFIGLAEQGYYNSTPFFRAVYDLSVQGGDATGTGSGGSSIWNGNGYPLEPSDQLHHYAGALCAAFDTETSSGLSQFYFVTATPEGMSKDTLRALTDNGTRQEVVDAFQAAGGLPYQDYTDTVFGQIYSGMEVADAIACVETDENDRPVADVTLNSVTITTYTAQEEPAASSAG